MCLCLGCSGDADSRTGIALEVATSTDVLADIVRNVGGERVRVWPVVPAGANLHAYWPTPRDIVRLQQSDLLVTVGANLEKFTESASWRRAIREDCIPLLEFAPLLELIKVDKVIDHGDHVHDLRDGDPHVWMDPAMVISMVELTAQRLAELDPDGAASYTANALRYREELLALHAEVVETLFGVPPEHRKLLVLHDAHAYFARRYGFEVIGYVTRTDNAEPSAKDVADLYETVRLQRIRAVFKEPNHDARILERLAEEQRVPVGVLLSDSLTREVTTYAGLIRHNAREIASLLGE